MSKSIGLYCPHCGKRLTVIGRKKPSPLMHNIYASCTNVNCQASFVARIELSKQIQDSLKPKQDINNNFKNLNPWMRELEFQIRSVEANPNVAKDTLQYLRGYIGALYQAKNISLEEAQIYQNRINQLSLFTDITA